MGRVISARRVSGSSSLACLRRLSVPRCRRSLSNNLLRRSTRLPSGQLRIWTERAGMTGNKTRHGTALDAQAWRQSAQDIRAYTGWTHDPPIGGEDGHPQNHCCGFGVDEPCAAGAGPGLLSDQRGLRFRSGSTSSRAWSPTATPSWIRRSAMPASRAAIPTSACSRSSAPSGPSSKARARRTTRPRVKPSSRRCSNSFATADGFALNPDAGVLMPLDARAE